jgi:hypothetical protein
VNVSETIGKGFEAIEANQRTRNRSPSLRAAVFYSNRDKRLDFGAAGPSEKIGGEQTPFPMTNPSEEKAAETTAEKLEMGSVEGRE